ncbi:MAG: enoyl-CoA hydratase-related protein [Longimicrobiales bacterium]|nr:enoyl-CoA hydratase-related protein [Longimicrobiales bacterium]
MSDEILLVEVVEGVATLTLNRPEKRNALNQALVQALKDALARVASDDDVSVVAIRGAGRDFCAGADLTELERIVGMSVEENLADARSLGALFVTLRELPKPVVAVVRGRALAGGCGLATACDVVLAHVDAEMGYPEVHLGFVPAMVMAILRRKVSEGRAFDLVARGHRVAAPEAREIGLVTHVFPSLSFDEDVARYLGDLASRPASALALTKSLLYELGDLGFSEGVERGAHVNAAARMTDACREGIRGFLERSRGAANPGNKT